MSVIRTRIPLFGGRNFFFLYTHAQRCYLSRVLFRRQPETVC